MRTLLLVGVVVLLAACGGSARPDSQPASEPDAPATPKPTLGTLTNGPPAAWVETEGGSFWLGYSSYCWRTVCADFVGPTCDDPKHTPKIVLRRDELVTAHLEFEPNEVGLSYFSATGGTVERQEKLEPSRTPSWRAERDGAFSLFTRVQSGDASYVGCAQFK